METQDKKKRVLPYVPLLVVVFFIAAAVLPLASIFSQKFTDLLLSKGIHHLHNADDGLVIAEFEDAAPALLRPIPPDLKKLGIDEKAIVIRKFFVKKVSFSKFAGAGIHPRLNLVFEFQGKLPNPHELNTGFGEPVIHVYIDAPGKSPGKTGSNSSPSSSRVAHYDFGNTAWDFQVIVDGFHEQPRIFSAAGEFVGTGFGIYVRGDNNTIMTAALPLDLVGDPSGGEWTFMVISGLTDLQSLSMMVPPATEGEPGIFQYFKSTPLKIKNPL
jgi:hypothetical protein